MKVGELRRRFDTSGHVLGGRCMPVLKHFTAHPVQNLGINSKGHVLYRMFGYDGRLLYIGVTRDLKVRCKFHAEQKPWWPDVAFLTVDGMFESRVQLETFELRAIEREQPLHNIAGQTVRACGNSGRPNGGLALSSPPVFSLAESLWDRAHG